MIKNLITNKDIKALNNKLKEQGSLSPDELTLLREQQFSESQIQSACNEIIKNRYIYLKDSSVIFQQNDNGREHDYTKKSDSPAVKLGKLAKIANQKKKKAREGTLTGWEDSSIWMYKKEMVLDLNDNPYKYSHAHIFVEFKKIGSPSEIKPSLEQKFWHDYHISWGASSHFCNNTVFFEQVICREIDTFLNI